MQSRNQLHQFNIDENQLEQIIEQLSATEKQIKLSWNRAINRTAITIKSRAMRVIKDEAQVRKIAHIRRRMKTFKINKGQRLDELKLWFGLNDMRVSALKGKSKRIGTKRKPKGAMFQRANGDVISDENSFIAKYKGRRSIFSRRTDKRFPLFEMKADIENNVQIAIEDDVFSDLPDIFMRHFISDLTARVQMGIRDYERRGQRRG